jgi:hypothetical protein
MPMTKSHKILQDEDLDFSDGDEITTESWEKGGEQPETRTPKREKTRLKNPIEG